VERATLAPPLAALSLATSLAALSLATSLAALSLATSLAALSLATSLGLLYLWRNVTIGVDFKNKGVTSFVNGPQFVSRSSCFFNFKRILNLITDSSFSTAVMLIRDVTWSKVMHLRHVTVQCEHCKKANLLSMFLKNGKN